MVAVAEVWSRFKASYGTAFKAPSLFDLFGVDSEGYVGNPNLLPERSEGYEIGWAVDVPAFGNPAMATLELTYFNNRITNLIETVFNADYTASTAENVARAKTQGVESSLTVRPAAWLQVVATYTFTDSRNAETNALLLRRPLNAASVNLRWTPLPGLVIVPQLTYTGAFQDFLIDDNGFPIGVGRARPGTIVDFSVNYALNPKLTLFLDARNLTNSTFEPASGYQTPGRSAIAGVRARF